MITPPPGLRAKLGLDTGAKALLIGIGDDQALADALAGVTTDDAGNATMAVAWIDGPDDLTAAQAARSATAVDRLFQGQG